MLKTFIMLGLICLAALIIELDFFIALPKFGAEHFGAPDDLKELAKKFPDRSRAVVAAGLLVMLVSFAGIAAVIVWSAIDTYRNYPGAIKVFLRYLTLLWGYKLFDIGCFDWLLLTKIRLPEKLYPATAGAKGYDSFGFNRKSQLIKMVIFLGIALIAAALFEVLHS